MRRPPCDPLRNATRTDARRRCDPQTAWDGTKRRTPCLTRNHETYAKRQSLNSEPGCIKVVDTFRHAPAKAGVTDRHPAVDYAQILKDLSDKPFPNVSQIVLVQDN